MRSRNGESAGRREAGFPASPSSEPEREGGLGPLVARRNGSGADAIFGSVILTAMTQQPKG